MTQYFLVDANIWFQTNMMRSAEGCALLTHVHQSDARLVLSSTLRSEIEANCTRKAQEELSAARRAISRLFEQLGLDEEELLEALPTDDETREIVRRRVAELDRWVHVPATSTEHCMRALSRVQSRRAPARDGQQFKDALLLEELLSVPREGEKVIISHDKAFFSDDGERVHPDLGGDTPCSLRAFRGITAFLRTTTSLVDEPLSRAVLAAIKTSAYYQVADQRDPVEVKMPSPDDAALTKGSAFRTDLPTKKIIAFETVLDATLLSEYDDSAEPVRIAVWGSCVFDYSTMSSESLDITRSVVLRGSEAVADVDWTEHRRPHRDLFPPFRMKRRRALGGTS